MGRQKPGKPRRVRGEGQESVSEKVARSLRYAEENGLFNEDGEWWEGGQLMMVHPDFLAKPEDMLTNEIPRQRILADLDAMDTLPPAVRYTVAKVAKDECDVVGCTGQLYACIQDHFFCESCAEGFIMTAPPGALDEHAFRITR